MRKFLTLALVAAYAVLPAEVSGIQMTENGINHSPLYTPLNYRYVSRFPDKGKTDTQKQRDGDIE